MRRVSTYQLRDNLSTYLTDIVCGGMPLVVEKYKKPLVIITPYDDSLVEDDFERFFGFMDNDGSGEKFVEKLRRSVRKRK
ncbi:type II toxin-antitoxin system Phd/YefM family antitoxin [Patescibacteria group bacterium]|nr:type II toxin-antitoxin system Phd/YefM family antitoxin [Patescibacteria group bacterium]